MTVKEFILGAIAGVMFSCAILGSMGVFDSDAEYVKRLGYPSVSAYLADGRSPRALENPPTWAEYELRKMSEGDNPNYELYTGHCDFEAMEMSGVDEEAEILRIMGDIK